MTEAPKKGAAPTKGAPKGVSPPKGAAAKAAPAKKTAPPAPKKTAPPPFPPLAGEDAATEPLWQRLEEEGTRLRGTHLRTLFRKDPERATRLSARFGGMLLDFSKEKLSHEALATLLELAEAAGVAAKREAMFAGAPINTTEGRAVLHTALRGGAGIHAGGEDISAAVAASRTAFLAFAEDVRQGRAAAADGKPFASVLHLGIGGSDLGPAMAVRALAPDADGPAVRFVANVDGAALADTLKSLAPERTLLIVSSKTFTTAETLANAAAAKAWLAAAVPEASLSAHLAAVSSAPEKATAFGVPPNASSASANGSADATPSGRR